MNKLRHLIGKTIKNIRVADFDSGSGGGDSVENVAEITFDNDEVVYLVASDPTGGDRFYAELILRRGVDDYANQLDEWKQ